MSSQKRQWHWDKRKKRYVMLGDNETVRGGKRIKTESGQAVAGDGKSKGSSANRGLYDKWVKSSHMRVAAAGTLEETGGKGGRVRATIRVYKKTLIILLKIQGLQVTCVCIIT